MPPTIAPAQREPAPAAPAVPLSPDAEKKRMLIIVNPYATTVSNRLKNLVVYALQARYEVEAVDTEAATAHYQSGMLIVELPIAPEPPKGERVAIAIRGQV